TFALILFVSDFITYRGLAGIMQSEMDSNLLSLASMESAAYSGGENTGYQELAKLSQLFPKSVPQFVQVIDSSRRVVSYSGTQVSSAPLISRNQLNEVLSGATIRANIHVASDQVRIAAIGGGPPANRFAVVAGTGTESLSERKGWTLFILFIVDVVTFAVSIEVGYLIIGRALRPVDHITERAREIGAGYLHQRIETRDASLEMERLITVLNEMFDKLQRLFESQRQFIQDASHEIRSPLAAIRCRLEVALRQPRPAGDYRNVIESCLQDVERLSALSEDMFLLARADSDNLGLDLREIAVNDVVTEVRDQLMVLAEERQIDFKLKTGAPCFTYGDRTCLHRAIRNIVENALKYTPVGGKVLLSSTVDGDYIKVEVEDTGVGIPADEQKNIFRRFYRVDPARSRGEGGAGLGLAICDQIIRAHGGSIEVDSVVGRGTRFTIALASGEALLDRAAV
ncbi:MAG TPA: ATP-binding protein, partial [Blastocatellia bacterium]|nr:ATP-binding protein [Blastocatellia bacterium]